MANDILQHYGTPRHSGRYPWGSGENPYQGDENFLAQYRKYKADGMTETEIANAMGLKSTVELRAKKSIETNNELKGNIARAVALSKKGYGATAIGKEMGVPESTVRSWLDPMRQERADIATKTADSLKEFVDKNKYVDIGPGAELNLGVSSDKLKTAVAMLEQQGYKKQYIQIDQMGTNHKTTITVLTPPDVDYSKLKEHKFDIVALGDKRIDTDGNVLLGAVEPKSVDSKRVAIRYAEEGGVEKDGVIELRRGVDDISLGNAKYAQVRIAVDGTHYLKGMAVYSDNLPDGVDILFNTNKHLGTAKLDVLKEMKSDKENPFGATIKTESELKLAQRYYIDKNGKKQLSCVNIVNEEGDWDTWSKTLASQFLSKQSPILAKRQLDLSYADKKAQFEEICSLTNPTIKRKLLESFADDCDASAVSLKAAALPRQHARVILPFPDMKENEVYAPSYKNGEQVALIRYPHAGTFEIPIVTVNNNQKTAKSVIRNAIDAIGINAKVAERLSGADFDGDSVTVIPLSRNVNIRSTKQLTGLKDFDPKAAYPAYEGMPVIKSQTKQTEMGKISNLITDMTIKGASEDELARAVRHSMVVIDAEKHKLNYKQSYIDNGIEELKKKYQNGNGSATIISRAKSPVLVNERKQQYKIDPETGKKIYQEKEDNTYTYLDAKNSKGKSIKLTVYTDFKTGEKYTVDPETKVKTVRSEAELAKAKTKTRTQESTKMAETDDAYKLTSGGSKENYGYQIEGIYANYANQMKSLGNQARKALISTGTLKYNKSAKETYAEEVKSLNASLLVALKNAPKERQAQLVANQMMDAKLKANPDMDSEHIKKAKGQCLTIARNRVGAQKQRIEISQKEWEAIQAGAISDSKLSKILDNTDLSTIQKLATPKQSHTLTSSQISLIKRMDSSDYTLSDIAERLGVSTSTVSNVLNG